MNIPWYLGVVGRGEHKTGWGVIEVKKLGCETKLEMNGLLACNTPFKREDKSRVGKSKLAGSLETPDS